LQLVRALVPDLHLQIFEMLAKLFAGNVEHLAEFGAVKMFYFPQDDQDVILGAVVDDDLPMAVADQSPEGILHFFADRVELGEVLIARVEYLDRKQLDKEDHSDQHKNYLYDFLSSFVHGRT
jgi:hypothetical protein